MYWSVVGAFVALEYVAEWVISWYVHLFQNHCQSAEFVVRFPFYWELKTLFLLYLALPQTQVSSLLVIRTYMEP